MHASTRNTLASAALLALVLATACDKKADETAAASIDSTAVVAPPAPQPPAELTARADSSIAAWNQENVAALASYFTDDAVAHEDTLTFTGKKEIQDKWIKTSLPGMEKLTVANGAWTAVGADFQFNGTYSLDANMDGKKATMTGKVDNTWTRGADGTWLIKAMTVTNDAPPATTTSK